MGMGLDGVAAGGWIPSAEDESEQSELIEDIWEQLRSVDTLLLGRVTFKMWEKYWPAQATRPSASSFQKEFSRYVDDVKKVVFSRTLKRVSWQNSFLVTGNILVAVSRMKSEPGKKMAVVGGPGIANTFVGLDLIDEYRIYIHPLIIGKGKPILGGVRQSKGLRLISAKVFRSGGIGLHLRRIEGS